VVRASVACAISPFDGTWLAEASVVGESSLWLALLQSTDWTGREAGPWFLSGASLLVLLGNQGAPAAGTCRKTGESCGGLIFDNSAAVRVASNLDARCTVGEASASLTKKGSDPWKSWASGKRTGEAERVRRLLGTRCVTPKRRGDTML